jgi:hypothetical protein
MKIQVMRRFAKSSRLQADSIPEVTKPFMRAVLDLSDTVTFDGGMLRPGHVLNALIHAFNEMPAEDRTTVVQSAMARLELLLAEDEEEKAAARERLDGLRVADREEVQVNEVRVSPDRSKRKKRDTA